MKIIKTKLPDLLVIQPDVFGDSRGYFFESFSEKKFLETGVNIHFVQDNISKSKKATIRGLHYQAGEMAQGKLCQVIYGKVLDVAVDIRTGSPTYGEYHSEILSEENHMQMWIPPGFAHGFSVLSDEAIFMYKCTQFYSKEHERGIRYNDPKLNINWQVTEPIVSEKDMNSEFFANIKAEFIYK
jgi:dTDP-4-dehydrorhamnose 3,5-epimerase